MKSILLMSLFGATMSLFASSSAESVFDAKCAMCHMKTIPVDKSTMIAPPVNGVMRHVKMRYPTKQESVAFIVEYVQNPSKTKAVCMKQKIARFGLMPSQKGNISPKELQEVAAWMFDTYPTAGFRGQGMMMQGNMGKKGMRNMCGMKHRPTFEMFDSNGDGVISKKEFYAFQNSRMAKRMANRGKRGMSCSNGSCPGMMKKGMKNRSTFTKLDLNNDGVITKDELLKARADKQAKRKAQGMPMKNANNAPSFESMDSNGDGKITKKEFSDFQSKHRMQAMKKAFN